MIASYLVATTKPWNLSQYADRAPRWPGVWRLIEKPEDLTHEALARIAPRYVFFPHWSWKVPSDITSDFVGVVPSSYPVDLIHLFTSGPHASDDFMSDRAQPAFEKREPL